VPPKRRRQIDTSHDLEALVVDPTITLGDD
jgi:hypothetical protein